MKCKKCGKNIKLRQSKKGAWYPVDKSGLPHRMTCGEPSPSKVLSDYHSAAVNMTVRAICTS